jgi:hypothetical protein
MGFFVGGSFVAALQIPATEHGESTFRHFWQWTTNDAVSFYTSFLALFTAVVGGSTIGLWIATNRNARIAERALTEHERPWLFLEGATVRMRDPRTATVIQNNWFIKLHFKNVGRAPAIVGDCIFKIAELSSLPAQPNYSGAGQLGIPRTISVGETVETDEVGPAPSRPNQQGAELVFFGRLSYSDLSGRPHHTGFALRVAPMMPASFPHNSRNYDFYD